MSGFLSALGPFCSKGVKMKMNPWWVTGLVDGEGCFQAYVTLRSRTGLDGRPYTKCEALTKLTVGLRADGTDVLYGIKDFFGCGSVYDKRPSAVQVLRGHTNPMSVFMVYSLTDLIKRVVPHFNIYPLQSKKRRDFELWVSILLFIQANLSGTKGWARRFPEKVTHLQNMCTELSLGRAFSTEAH